MKTGVSMFSFTEDADLKRLFPLIKKAGYDGVEPVSYTHLWSNIE